MPCIKDSTELQRHKQAESERMKKDIPHEWQATKRGQGSQTKHLKFKNVSRDKGHLY